MLLRNTCVSLGMAQTRVSRLNFWRLRTPGAALKRSGRGQQARRFIVLSSAPIRASPLLAVLQMGLCIFFFFFDDKNGFTARTCWVTPVATCPGGGRPEMLSAPGKGETLCTDPAS